MHLLQAPKTQERRHIMEFDFNSALLLIIAVELALIYSRLGKK